MSKTNTVKLVAAQPINHDGVEYAEGDTFEVTEAQAVQLVASQSAQREVPSTKAKAGDKG